MAWIKVDQTLKDHRKLQIAADILGIPPAYFMGLIVNFWLWALDNAPTGNLVGISARMIAHASQWEGSPEVLLSALIEAGFLDRNDAGDLAIHDWYAWVGRLVEQRQREKERSARRRNVASQKNAPEVDRRSTAGRVDQTKVDQCSVDNTPSSPSTGVDQKGKRLDNVEVAGNGTDQGNNAPDCNWADGFRPAGE